MILILLFFFLAVLLVQLYYYLYVFGTFSFSKITESRVKRIPISILVCAKNEEENVKILIPKLLQQNYPDFEIVLIDDASSDGTLEIFEEFEKISDKIKLVKVQNNEAFWGNKKFALTLGIKAAKHDYLLFTDADCLPNSDNWVKEMSSNFTSQKNIVLGYGGYERIKKSFLNQLIRLDTLLIATQYFSWAKLGKPYMGIGRNMAYHRSEFFDNNGFINHMKIKSGDDDLFINEVATKKNTTICFTPDSFTISKVKTDFIAWKNQKLRHITTSRYYKKADKMRLGGFVLSQLLFFVLLAVSVVLGYYEPYQVSFQLEILLALVVLRYIAVYVTLFHSTKKLKEKELLLSYPILEISLLFFQIYLFFTSLITKNTDWK